MLVGLRGGPVAGLDHQMQLPVAGMRDDLMLGDVVLGLLRARPTQVILLHKHFLPGHVCQICVHWHSPFLNDSVGVVQ